MKKIYLLLLAAMAFATNANAQVDNYCLQLSKGNIATCGLMPEMANTNTYTIQAWVCPDEWTEDATILRLSDDAKLQLGAANTVKFTVSGSEVSATSTDLAAGTWAHLTVISDNGSVKILVNGTEAGSGTLGELPEANHFGIGGSIFAGRVDDVRLWNTATFDEHFNYFMNTTLNKWNPYWDNLVAYYKMDFNECDDLVDFKTLYEPYNGYNHHGEMNGATLTKVTDNTGLVYRQHGAYTDLSRFFDRGIDREKYLLSNDLIVLSLRCQSDGHLKHYNTNDHGTMGTGVTWKQSQGTRSGVLHFSGTGSFSTTKDVLDVLWNGDKESANPINGYTIETWIYPEELTQGAFVFNKYNFNTKKGFYISLNSDGTFNTCVNDTMFTTSSLKLETGKWQYIAVTCNSSGVLTAYLGGKTQKLGTLKAGRFNITGYAAEFGKNFKGYLDECAVWEWNFGKGQLQSHQNKGIQLPALGTIVTAGPLNYSSAYYTFDDEDNIGWDYFSQDNWVKIMRSAYDGYRGWKIRLSVAGNDKQGNKTWNVDNAGIKTAAGRENFATDLANEAADYDGVELDLEWSMAQAGINAINALLPLIRQKLDDKYGAGVKTLMLSCHPDAPFSYHLTSAGLAAVDGLTFQHYGPNTPPHTWAYYTKHYANYVSYGLPEEKFYMSYATTTSAGNGSTTGIRANQLHDTPFVGAETDGSGYTVDWEAGNEYATVNGNKFYFQGPAQVYRRTDYVVQHNNLGIFYWDMGNDVSTQHVYSLPKWCSYALNANVDSIVTSVTINNPTSVTTGITQVESKIEGADRYFSIDGKQMARPGRGITIVRRADGTVTKEM